MTATSFRFLLLLVCLPGSVTRPASAALGEDGFVRFAPAPGAAALANAGATAPLVVDLQDWPGVLRAAHDLQADIERVTGVRPTLVNTPPVAARVAIIIGTLGHSPLIDDLVRRGKLDARAIAGHWEAFVREVVEQP